MKIKRATPPRPEAESASFRCFAVSDRSNAEADAVVHEMQETVAEAVKNSLGSLFEGVVGVTVVLSTKTAQTGDLRLVVDTGVDEQCLDGLADAAVTLLLALDAMAGVNVDPPLIVH